MPQRGNSARGATRDELAGQAPTATLGWLQLARNANIERFIQVSSSEVYGPAQTVPMNEGHPTAPTTVYGASKLAGESHALAMHRSWQLPVTVVRPFNTFGPRCHHEGDAGEVIPRFVLRALAGEALIVFGEGTQTRDFTYVADTARGIADAGRPTRPSRSDRPRRVATG